MSINSANSTNLDLIYRNLLTVEETNFFIRNIESFLKGDTPEESIIKNYSFLSSSDLLHLKKEFHKIRTDLLSRKKVKIYTPITISKKLIEYLHPIFCKFTNSSIILDPFQDNSIVAGLKFSLDGKIYNLSIDYLNSNKVNSK